MKNEKIYGTTEAARFLGVSPGTVTNKVRSGKLSPIPGRKPMKFTQSELESYKFENSNVIRKRSLQFSLAFDESLKPVSVHSMGTKNKPMNFNCTCLYEVSNHGRVFNVDSRKELAQSNATHGYRQVALSTPNGKVFFRVHDLVAAFWCPNRHGWTEIHHVDGNRTNNRKENLLPVDHKPHKKLHELMDEAKKTNDWSKYYKRIEEIRKDNEYDGDYSAVVFEHKDRIIFAWIPKSDYDSFIKGEKSLDEIEGVPFSQIKVISFETGG